MYLLVLCRRKCRNPIHLLYLRFFFRATYASLGRPGRQAQQAQGIAKFITSTSMLMLVDDYAHRGRATASSS